MTAIIRMAELPESTSIAALRNRLTVSLDPLLVSGDRFASVGDQVLLTLTASASDPQETVSIVSAWITAFEMEFREVFLDRTARSLQYFQENLGQTEAELNSVIEQRVALLSENPLDIMQRDVDVLLNRYSLDMDRLHTTRNELGIARAHLGALEAELSQRQSTLVLLRTLNPEALVAAVASGLPSRDYQILVGTRVEEEVLNATFFVLDEMIATERARIATLESELVSLEAHVASVLGELAVKQPEVLMIEAALEDLDAQIILLRSARTELAANLQNARIALAETLDPIHIINEPLIPRHPIAPRKSTNIAVAGFLGLMMGTLLAFLVDYLGRVQKQETDSGSPEKEPLQAPRDRNTDESTEPERNEYREEPPA